MTGTDLVHYVPPLKATRDRFWAKIPQPGACATRPVPLQRIDLFDEFGHGGGIRDERAKFLAELSYDLAGIPTAVRAILGDQPAARALLSAVGRTQDDPFWSEGSKGYALVRDDAGKAVLVHLRGAVPADVASVLDPYAQPTDEKGTDLP